jgi:hypothetical protein
MWRQQAGGANVALSTVADSTAIAGTGSDSETAFDTTVTIPANSLRAGDRIHIRALVDAIGVTSTPNLTIKLYIGTAVLSGTLIMSTGAVAVVASGVVLIDAELTIRTIGATAGRVVGSSSYIAGVVGTATAKVAAALGSTLINTAVAQLVGASAQWSAANASNTCLLRQLSVDITHA